jgi:hypothetical protein
MESSEFKARLEELELRQVALLAALAAVVKHLPQSHSDLRMLAAESPGAPVPLSDAHLQVFATTIRAVLRDPDSNPWPGDE